ncbi:MAG: M20/M25/M40 family metallo-hydrolase [Actinomycetota bacterium]
MASNVDTRTNQTIELLQTLIRNECVNDGRAESGQEVRNCDVIETFVEGPGVEIETFEPTPGRKSLVARMEGYDPSAPTLCLMGHTDVVPANSDGWTHDPFGGDLVNGEIWGRGAVDMLNLTSSMAVAFKHLAETNFKPRGNLIYFAVADEESGSAHGAQWIADNHPDAIRSDYVLTENGGLHTGSEEAPFIGMNVGEKGVAWRRLRVSGTPGHGSAPFKTDNALVKAAAIVQRLADYRPPPKFHELWREQVDVLNVDAETKAIMLDPDLIDDYLDAHPVVPLARHFYSCVHTTFSPNVLTSDSHMKTNVIPDHIDIKVDIRTLPGERTEDVQAHLNIALGELADQVEVEIIMDDPASISRVQTPLWDTLQKSVNQPFPNARITPQLIVGFTDARVFRNMGATAYGAGLFSPDLKTGDFSARFHGHNERIDTESLALSTQLWVDVVKDFLG